MKQTYTHSVWVYLLANPNSSAQKVAAGLGIPFVSVQHAMQRLRESGAAEVTGRNNSARWSALGDIPPRSASIVAKQHGEALMALSSRWPDPYYVKPQMTVKAKLIWGSLGK